MALQIQSQMSARTQSWRHNYATNREARQVANYGFWALTGLITVRVVIMISRQVSFLMPVGLVASFLYSAFELALAAAAIIIVAIGLAAAIGFSTSALLGRLRKNP